MSFQKEMLYCLFAALVSWLASADVFVFGSANIQQGTNMILKVESGAVTERASIPTDKIVSAGLSDGGLFVLAVEWAADAKPPEATLFVLDRDSLSLESRTRVEAYPLGLKVGLSNLAVTPDGKWVYYVSQEFVEDRPPMVHLAKVDVRSGKASIISTPKRSGLFYTYIADGTVCVVSGHAEKKYVVDQQHNTAVPQSDDVAPLPIGVQLKGGAFMHLDGQTVFVESNRYPPPKSGHLVILNAKELEQMSELDLGFQGRIVGWSRKGDLLFLYTEDTRMLRAYSLHTKSTEWSVTLPADIGHVEQVMD